MVRPWNRESYFSESAWQASCGSSWSAFLSSQSGVTLCFIFPRLILIYWYHVCSWSLSAWSFFYGSLLYLRHCETKLILPLKLTDNWATKSVDTSIYICNLLCTRVTILCMSNLICMCICVYVHMCTCVHACVCIHASGTPVCAGIQVNISIFRLILTSNPFWKTVL